MPPADQEYRKYVSLIAQHRFLFTGIAVLVCTVGILIGYLLPAKYEAKSTVFIEKSLITDLVEGIAVTQSMEDRLKLLTHVLSSRNLLQKVVDDLDLDLVGQTGKGSRLIRDFQKNTQVTVSRDDLFIIQYAHPNPRLARDYVNTLIQKYIETSLAATRQESYGANRFMAEQMEHFRNKIKEAEDRLNQFTQKEPYTQYVDDSVLITELHQAEAALDELQLQKEQLLARRSQLNRAGVAGGTSGDHLNQLQRKRDQLLLFYTENYPEVRLVNAEIEQIKKEMNSYRPPKEPTAAVDASGDGALLTIQLSAVGAREGKLQKSVEERKAILASLPEKRKIYNELVRDRDTYKYTYEQLVLRHGKSELSKQMEIQDKAGTFRIVDPAILATKPVSPNRVPIILLSLAAGVAVGFVAIFALDYLDSSVRSIEAVQELGLPLLALIPQFTTTEEAERQRRQGMALTAFVVVYLLGVFAVLTFEVLQILDVPGIDSFLQSLRGQQTASLGDIIRNLV
ncbi:MAG: hypothetical protein IH614_04490 [Desulfuromonadales bacterium]|nr:hypothetical protein [Desulfuromonadales bacterium]